MVSGFDAPVTVALFDGRGRAGFALGDGSVRLEDRTRVDAHDGAVLCACVHPSGEGFVTGGDDGLVCWSNSSEAARLANARGRWIDAVTASPVSGLIAFSAGKTATVLDQADPVFRRDFEHDRSVADLAFDPKGRRLATATYGGAVLWFARIETQKPALLKWAGSHTRVAFSPDGAFLISAMQENQLHGWRLKDGKDLRMGGYPTKIRDMAFFDGGKLLATSGSHGAVAWPFVGSNGPEGKEAAELGYDEASVVVRVAATPMGDRLAGGTSDGRVWVTSARTGPHRWIKSEKGAAISALAVSQDGARLAWGDEQGDHGLVDL